MRTRSRECVVFGQAVKDLRQKREISQEHLAVLTGMHRTYIGGIERGERNPTLITIHKLAAALQVPPHRLLQAQHSA